MINTKLLQQTNLSKWPDMCQIYQQRWWYRIIEFYAIL